MIPISGHGQYGLSTSPLLRQRATFFSRLPQMRSRGRATAANWPPRGRPHVGNRQESCLAVRQQRRAGPPTRWVKTGRPLPFAYPWPCPALFDALGSPSGLCAPCVAKKRAYQAEKARRSDLRPETRSRRQTRLRIFQVREEEEKHRRLHPSFQTHDHAPHTRSTGPGDKQHLAPQIDNRVRMMTQRTLIKSGRQSSSALPSSSSSSASSRLASRRPARRRATLQLIWPRAGLFPYLRARPISWRPARTTVLARIHTHLRSSPSITMIRRHMEAPASSRRHCLVERFCTKASTICSR